MNYELHLAVKNKSIASFQRGDSIEEEDSENGVNEIATRYETVELNDAFADDIENVDLEQNFVTKRFLKSPFKNKSKKKERRKGKIVSLSRTDRSYAYTNSCIFCAKTIPKL